jgi:uncharacterized protein involved in response to NO
MIALTIIPFNVAIANGYTKLNNIMGSLSLLITIPGYWIATRIYGAIGAAIVSCSVQTIFTLIYLYVINKKYFGSRLLKNLYLKQIFFPLICSLIIIYLLSLIPDYFPNNRFFSVLWIFFTGLITIISSAFILLPKAELMQIFKLKKNVY